MPLGLEFKKKSFIRVLFQIVCFYEFHILLVYLQKLLRSVALFRNYWAPNVILYVLFEANWLMKVKTKF